MLIQYEPSCFAKNIRKISCQQYADQSNINFIDHVFSREMFLKNSQNPFMIGLYACLWIPENLCPDLIGFEALVYYILVLEEASLLHHRYVSSNSIQSFQNTVWNRIGYVELVNLVLQTSLYFLYTYHTCHSKLKKSLPCLRKKPFHDWLRCTLCIFQEYFLCRLLHTHIHTSSNSTYKAITHWSSINLRFSNTRVSILLCPSSPCRCSTANRSSLLSPGLSWGWR